ncbi:MAG: hypothetical protein DRN06_07305 [Thermoprotei archaeon]|nr:MAG: hypothetical protein DRN06_07305 [Thermoprotei archaeon]
MGNVSVETRQVQFERGLTGRAILAIFFASLFFLPISIYLQLVSGVTVSAIAVYVTAILFSELALLLGSPLRRQELFIIVEMCGIAGTTTFMVELIFRGFVVTSPLSYAFRIEDAPISRLIPSWWAPRQASEVYVLRTLLHPDWAVPILLTVIHGVFTILTEFSLLMIVSMLYIEIENLPYPLATIDAEMINTLSERDPRRLGIFSQSTIIGMLFGFLIHVPYITLGIQLVPLPWLDLTVVTEQYLPGAIIGVTTEPLAYVGGMLIPLTHAAFMFISSITCWIFLNSLFLTKFPHFFPRWSEEYVPGMGISLLYQRSYMHVWLIPGLTFSLVLAVLTITTRIGSFKRALTSMWYLSDRLSNAGYQRLTLILAMYLLGTLGSVILFHLLVPDFPIIIPLALSVGLSFLNGIVGARLIGETGYGITMINVWYPFVYLTGYRGINAWLYSPVIGGALSSRWSQIIKVAYLTRTRPGDFIKAFLLTWVAYRIFGTLWASFFWSVAPIPSAAYPYAAVQWPINLITLGMWVTRQLEIRTEVIAYSASVMALVLSAGTFLSKSLGIPFSPSGVVVGSMLIPPTAIAVLVGSIIGNVVLPRMTSREWWREYRSVLVSGFAAGEGTAIGMSIIGALLSKAVWAWPY